MCCAHSGRMVTGERKIKRTKSGDHSYSYYRCSGYNTADHPRVRVREAELDRQMLATFDRMKVAGPDARDWLREVLAAQTCDAQADTGAQREELMRQSTLIVGQQDRLLNLHIGGGIDETTFAAKSTELRNRMASIKLQLDVLDHSYDATADLAGKVFEFTQTLRERCVSAGYTAKHRILEILRLCRALDGATLLPKMRKPFAALAEGLLSNISRGKRTL